MEKIIKVETKSVYGKTLIYPVCETGKMLCEIAGTKSFCDRILKILKKKGYLFVEEKTSII